MPTGASAAGHETKQPAVRQLRTRFFVVVLMLLLVPAGWLISRWRVERLPSLALTPRPVQFATDQKPVIRYPEGTFVTTVATFHDELFAYLMFQHERASKPFRDLELLLYFHPQSSEPTYEILVNLGDDLLGAIVKASQLHTARAIETYDWRLYASSRLDRERAQTRVFVAAYERPVETRLEELPRSVVRHLVQRFIRFKSTTDLRVRRRIESGPKVLRPHEAQQLAGDIITVSDFYDLPLEFFLGIGAMENNYMNVRGDLEHSIWKRRPAKDDVILERRKGRVRVLNDSTGVWQITRESLRWAHRLYLRDTRDYNLLPEHLRPPAELDVREVRPGVLTTYAGLLLRNLLDRFDGDVSLAVGAYNGGPGNPNARYSQGVQNVAQYARSVIEHGAALRPDSVQQQLQ